MVGLGGDRNFESVQDLDHFQQKTVRDKKREALKAAQTSVKNAYELVLSLEKDGSIQAKKITLGAQSSLPRLCRKGRSGYSTKRSTRKRSCRMACIRLEQFERDPRLPKLLSGRTARCAGRSLYSHGPLRSIVLAFGDRRHRLGQNAEASLSGQVTLNALQFGGDPASRIA